MKLTTIIFLVIILVSCTKTTFAFEYKEVTEDGLVASFYYTEGGRQQRPIIIFGGSSGGNFAVDSGRRNAGVLDLVNEGYAVLALSYFDYNGVGQLPTSLKQIPLEYFETAMVWLAKQPGVRGDSIAIYGTSRGGELALLLASHYPKIKVVIAAVPSAYVWGSYNRSKSERIKEYRVNPCGSAWTYQGKEIPSICSNNLLSYHPWYKIIDEPKYVDEYVIPVEKMSAAVLLLSGKYDHIWPSEEMSNRIIKRLEQFKYPHVYKHLTYWVGHSVFLVS